MSLSTYLILKSNYYWTFFKFQILDCIICSVVIGGCVLLSCVCQTFKHLLVVIFFFFMLLLLIIFETFLVWLIIPCTNIIINTSSIYPLPNVNIFLIIVLYLNVDITLNSFIPLKYFIYLVAFIIDCQINSILFYCNILYSLFYLILFVDTWITNKLIVCSLLYVYIITCYK